MFLFLLPYIFRKSSRIVVDVRFPWWSNIWSCRSVIHSFGLHRSWGSHNPSGWVFRAVVAGRCCGSTIVGVNNRLRVCHFRGWQSISTIRVHWDTHGSHVSSLGIPSNVVK
jgi:hypothetical protein